MAKKEKCEHLRLNKILGGPEYQCTSCGAWFKVEEV